MGLEKHIELLVGDTWMDITSDVYVRDGLTITRGRSAAASTVDPASCTFTINNKSGKYSPRNPVSPYYGLIGRNTPVRVSVNAGPPRLVLDGSGSGVASTPDGSALDITGDIDVRAEIEPDLWYSTDSQVLLSKWDATNDQRSWALYLLNGQLSFLWSTDGTNLSEGLLQTNDADLHGHVAVRVALDVGATTGTARGAIYTAPSLDGPWTVALQTEFPGRTTSVFSGTAPLATGTAVPAAVPPWAPCAGKVYRAEVRNGIDGPIVAAPDFTVLAPGTTEFTDSAGRPWTVVAPAAVTNKRIRFVGEVSSWPASWNVSGRDVWVSVQGAGILRRLGQGASPVMSTMRRELSSPVRSAAFVAYWPCEDGSTATQIAGGFPGVPPMTIDGGAQPAAYSNWPPSAPMPTMGAGTLRGNVPSVAATGALVLHMFVALPADGVESTTGTRLATFTTSGTARTWELWVDSTSRIRVDAYDDGGASGTPALILDSGYQQLAHNGQHCNVSWIFNQTAANTVTFDLQIGDLDLATLDSAPTVRWTGPVAGTLGRAVQVTIGQDGGLGETAVGHIAVATDADAFVGDLPAMIGWAHESASSRIIRVAGENGIPIDVTGDVLGSASLGPQAIDTALNILQSAADADGGLLYESREALGLAYRARGTQYNQNPRLRLEYGKPGHVAPPFQPTDDDQQTRNDVTVARTGGGSAEAILVEGPLSIQAPPLGVGIYDSSTTLNLYVDDQLPGVANWLLHLGTWDEARYPSITVNLARATDLLDAATSTREHDVLLVDNLPTWLPSRTALEMIEGYSEDIGVVTWSITYNTTPAGPWTVAVTDDPMLGRLDTDGSRLADALAATATTAAVEVTDGRVWITSAKYADEFPFDVQMAGEHATVTDIRDSRYDTFTRGAILSGWGNADSGQAWVTLGGSSADYSVNATFQFGAVKQASTNSGRLTLLPAPGPDIDLYVDVATSALAAGASLSGGPLTRATDNNSLYMARVDFTPTQTITLTLQKRIPDMGNITLGSTYTSMLTHTPATFYRVRFQVFGSTLRARVWPAGAIEPGEWHVSATDTDLTAAANVGTRSFSNSGNTNSADVQVWFTNFHVVNPQTFTLTRGSNGITKAQAAGTPVSLANPTVLAL